MNGEEDGVRVVPVIGGGCGGEMVTMAWWCVVMAGVGWQWWLDGWGGARVEWRRRGGAWRRVVWWIR
ncbi:hypothetical protein Tco_0392807 [Tanacetum coccineum]